MNSQEDGTFGHIH